MPTFIKDYAEIVMYADDCALIVSGNDKKEVESKVNKVLNLTNNWLEQNNLKMDLVKTSYLLLKKLSKQAHLGDQPGQ